MWSEIFWWEDNIALNLSLTNNFIYKVHSWQVVTESVQLKYDAMESGSDSDKVALNAKVPQKDRA